MIAADQVLLGLSNPERHRTAIGERKPLKGSIEWLQRHSSFQQNVASSSMRKLHIMMGPFG
jgi:hypothetical protein